MSVLCVRNVDRDLPYEKPTPTALGLSPTEANSAGGLRFVDVLTKARPEFLLDGTECAKQLGNSGEGWTDLRRNDDTRELASDDEADAVSEVPFQANGRGFVRIALHR